LVYTEGITAGKKFKQSKKKNDDVSFFTNEITDGIKSVGNFVDKMLTLFIMSITDGITNEKFRRYFPESSGNVHSPIVLLITIF